MKPVFISRSWNVEDARLGGSEKLLRQAKRRDRRADRHAGKAILRQVPTPEPAVTVSFPTHISVCSWDQIFYEIAESGYTSPENFWESNYPELCLD